MNAMPLFAYHFSRSQNIGDTLASPLRYVDYGRPVRVLDIAGGDTIPSGDVVIGGGGIFFNGASEAIGEALKHDHHTRILWGAGTNYLGEHEAIYPDYLSEFKLVGVRDFGTRLPHVPGPTCMHREFQIPRPAPQHEAVIYEHGGNRFSDGIPDFPAMTNYHHADDMWKVLDHLASGAVVISNSYHGCYWAALLGRKVLCWESNSNRFLFTPWRMTFCDRGNWKQKLKEAVSSEYRLTEAIDSNLMFASKVMELVV